MAGMPGVRRSASKQDVADVLRAENIALRIHKRDLRKRLSSVTMSNRSLRAKVSDYEHLLRIYGYEGCK